MARTVSTGELPSSTGRVIMKRVPEPLVLTTSMRPWMDSTAARTASRPTPRPEVSVTSVRVLKPGRKMRSRSCASCIRAHLLRGDEARALGRRAHRLHVDAAPVVAQLQEEHVALLLHAQGERALVVLAGALALVGHLDAVVHRVAQQVHHARP